MSSSVLEKIIVSEDRVASHGEVFTPTEIVCDMTNLIGCNTERFDCVVLEPSCGTGNFLIEILDRRISRVRKTYMRSQNEYEHYIFVSISTLFGIELIHENILECRKRMFSKVEDFYLRDFENSANLKFLELLKFVISKNIVHGNFITGMNASSSDKMTFTQWTFFKTKKLKRRDFVLESLSSKAQLVLLKEHELLDAFSLLD